MTRGSPPERRRNSLRLLPLLLTSLLVVASCGSFVPYTKTIVATHEDPDRLYAAAVRVLVREGWGLQARDPNARVVETSTSIVHPELDSQGRKVRIGFRIIVNAGNIEVFTNCVAGAIDRPCPEGERPADVNQREQRLVAAIRAESNTLPTTRGDPGPDRAGAAACLPTCGKDRESCQKGCGASEACKKGCNDGYIACVQACSGSGR
jgi:hypothetical protein